MAQEGAAQPPPHSKSRYSKGDTYRRNRRETKFDIPEMAHKLKHEVAKYCMNEKYVPKRWRYIDGKPAIDYAAKIREAVIIANEIPLDTAHIKIRENYQQTALSYCHLLELQLMDIAEECDGATHDNLHNVTDSLNTLYSRIKRWKQSDSKRPKDENPGP